MSNVKYIFDEKNKTLETLEGQFFLNNDAEVTKFDTISAAYKYLKENDISGVIGLSLIHI